jgi:MFS family permease
MEVFMADSRIISFGFLPTFQNKDEYFEKIIQEHKPLRRIISLYLLLIIFSFVYGLVMGSFHSLAQALTAGVKVPVLFSLALLICFPAFFIIQFVLGSKLKLAQMISIILSGFVLTTSIMVSFAPIVIFFLLTGSNYYFLQLLHIAIFILSGIFGMKTVIDALKISCEKKNIYPRTGVVVFRFWIVILAFVGIQLAWNLRPFLGDEGQPYKLFRKYKGNFYTALIYSFEQLSGHRQKESEKIITPDEPDSAMDLDSLFRFDLE